MESKFQQCEEQSKDIFMHFPKTYLGETELRCMAKMKLVSLKSGNYHLDQLGYDLSEKVRVVEISAPAFGHSTVTMTIVVPAEDITILSEGEKIL